MLQIKNKIKKEKITPHLGKNLNLKSKKVRKAAIREKLDRQERQFALKINIKHAKGQSQHTSYRSYYTRVKGGSQKWKQKIFQDSRLCLDVVGINKM